MYSTRKLHSLVRCHFGLPIIYSIYGKKGEKTKQLSSDISPKATLEALTDVSWLPFQVFIAENSFYDKLRLMKTLLYSDTPPSESCPAVGPDLWPPSLNRKDKWNFSPRINNYYFPRLGQRTKLLISPTRWPPFGFWRVCPQKLSELKHLSCGQADNIFDITHICTVPEKSTEYSHGRLVDTGSSLWKPLIVTGFTQSRYKLCFAFPGDSLYKLIKEKWKGQPLYENIIVEGFPCLTPPFSSSSLVFSSTSNE